MSDPGTLPENATFETLEGTGFIRIRDAARLGKVHPTVLEMAQKLIKSPGNAGVAFALATPELVKRAGDLEKSIRSGLRKAGKALDPAHKLKVKSHRDGNRLVFWYVA